jgi:hypothetical protein
MIELLITKKVLLARNIMGWPQAVDRDQDFPVKLSDPGSPVYWVGENPDLSPYEPVQVLLVGTPSRGKYRWRPWSPEKNWDDTWMILDEILAPRINWRPELGELRLKLLVNAGKRSWASLDREDRFCGADYNPRLAIYQAALKLADNSGISLKLRECAKAYPRLERGGVIFY